jgi:mannose-6-phosphate isomerase-like protein (cupin superfamily)
MSTTMRRQAQDGHMGGQTNVEQRRRGTEDTMAFINRTIDNPINGERVTFLATGQETNGALVKILIELPADSQGQPLHYHLAYTETFEVVEGQLDICLGSKKHQRVVRSGESVHVPLKAVHSFWNSSPEPVRFTVEIRPARHFEEALRTGFGLARDGRMNNKGIPTNIWELALIFELSESFLPGMPLLLQRGIFGVLAKIARWKGYDPRFSKYTQPSEG